ncbi:MAG: hypothetical protein ACOY0T_40070 [Myxococcota bacterium]
MVVALPGYSYDVAVADLNNDGIPDVAVALNDPPGIYVMKSVKP